MQSVDCSATVNNLCVPGFVPCIPLEICVSSFLILWGCRLHSFSLCSAQCQAMHTASEQLMLTMGKHGPAISLAWAWSQSIDRSNKLKMRALQQKALWSGEDRSDVHRGLNLCLLFRAVWAQWPIFVCAARNVAALVRQVNFYLLQHNFCLSYRMDIQFPYLCNLIVEVDFKMDLWQCWHLLSNQYVGRFVLYSTFTPLLRAYIL